MDGGSSSGQGIPPSVKTLWQNRLQGIYLGMHIPLVKINNIFKKLTLFIGRINYRWTIGCQLIS